MVTPKEGVAIAGEINSYVVAQKMQYEAQKRGDRNSEKLWQGAEEESAKRLIAMGIPVVGWVPEDDDPA